MKKFKITRLLLAITLVGVVACGCGKKEEEPEVVIDTEVNEVESPENIDIAPEGMIRSDLTGEWIDESFKNQRPVACMINNLSVAMPQSGIGQADIVYEMEVEGGITRLMAVFQDYSNLEKVGPIRSARHYYIKTAMEYDAIFAHVGQSCVAEQFISTSGVNNINGLTNSMIFRDNSRKAPHNAYSNSEKFVQAINNKGYSTACSESYEKKFEFNKEDTDLADGTTANKIEVAYNSNRKPYFEYDSENKVYLRFQYGDKQIDDQTNEQLAYKNVIVQFCAQEPLLDELIEIHLVGEGTGYYFTDGKCIPITWKKESENGVCKYYYENGEQLEMNQGKTWISIFSNSHTQDVTFE